MKSWLHFSSSLSTQSVVSGKHLIQEKSACCVEVSVTEQILPKISNFQKSMGNWACTNSAVFSLPTHKSLQDYTTTGLTMGHFISSWDRDTSLVTHTHCDPEGVCLRDVSLYCTCVSVVHSQLSNQIAQIPQRDWKNPVSSMKAIPHSSCGFILPTLVVWHYQHNNL